MGFSFEGLGFFYASPDMNDKGDAVKSAKKAKRFGASWCAVLVESVDSRTQSPERVAECVKALRAEGIEPWLYSFPRRDRIAKAIEHAEDCGKASECMRLVWDVEPHEIDTYGDWTQADVNRLADGAIARGFEIGWSVFTRRRWDGIRFPNGPMLLQVYERVRDTQSLARAVDRWTPGGREVVCAIGTYFAPDRIRSDAKNALQHNATALAIWSLATTSDREGATLAAIAQGFKNE